MAEQSSTALKELDEQLTCSVCLDQYTNPKTLQCHHSFCLTCIERLPQELQVWFQYKINDFLVEMMFTNSNLFLLMLIYID